MQTLHTAQIHRLLTTPVSLDLGTTTGALADISRQVAKLDAVIAETAVLPQRFANLGAHVSNEAFKLNEAIQKALLATADDIVQRIHINPAPVPVVFEIGTTAAPLVRLLVQAQGYALAREPGVTDDRGDENAAMKKLSAAARKEANKVFGDDDKALHERYLTAFEPFTSAELPYRSERFEEMHTLTEAVALHFEGA